MSKFHNIIRAPLITEKNTMLREKNKYVFQVATDATKPQIREAIEKLFSVNVVSVTTAVVKGKLKRMGRFSGHRSDWKKAFVRIADGQKIEKFGEA